MSAHIAKQVVRASAAVVAIGLLSSLAHGAAVLIDDFESYATGQIDDEASPPWYANTSTAIVEDDGGNQIAGFGWTATRGASRLLPAGTELADGVTGTYFWRIRQDDTFPNEVNNVGPTDVTSYGLSYSGAPDGDQPDRDLTNYEVLLAVTAEGKLVAGDGTSLVELMDVTLGQWINIWVEVDNASDTYDVFANTDAFTAPPDWPDPADLMAGNLLFRNSTGGLQSQDLLSFVMAGDDLENAQGTDYRNTAKADDIYFIIPEPATAVCLLMGTVLAFRRQRRG